MELIVTSKDIIIHHVTLPGGTRDDRVVIPIDKVLEPRQPADAVIAQLEAALTSARQERDAAREERDLLLHEKQQWHDLLDGYAILPLDRADLDSRIKNLIGLVKERGDAIGELHSHVARAHEELDRVIPRGGSLTDRIHALIDKYLLMYREHSGIPTPAQVAELHEMLNKIGIPHRTTVRERVKLLIDRENESASDYRQDLERHDVRLKRERERGDRHRDGRLRLAGKLNEIRAVLHSIDGEVLQGTGECVKMIDVT